MKSDKISIFNYEAFYLDHLEGTLGEEDTVLLLAFLADHLELIVDEDDFITLDPKNDAPVFADKDSLKIVSDDAVIALANVEYFLVAEAEGQLTASKQTELNELVNQHPHLETERRYLAAMFLKADQSIVYAEKSGLKKKGAIIFWPYIALAAASILIAFFFVMNNDSETSNLADKNSTDKKELPKEKSPIKEPAKLQLADDVIKNDSEKSSNKVSPTPNRAVFVNQESTPERPRMANVNALKYQRARKVINSVDNQNLQPIASQIQNPVVKTITPEDDYTLAMSSEMKNPIKPITSRISSFTFT